MPGNAFERTLSGMLTYGLEILQPLTYHPAKV